MGLIGIKIKDVKDFLKVNKSIKMPTILKNSKGEFVADGGYKDVYTYAHYKAQVELYEEFLKYLETKYNTEIPKMFKAALTKVIALKNEGLTTKRLHHKDMTKAQFESFTEEEYLRTLNYISSAALEKRLLRPAKAIKEFTTRKDASMLHNAGSSYVFPVISENGVVLKRRGDVRGQFQASTITIPFADARELAKAIEEEAKVSGAGEDVQGLIKEVFELATMAGKFDKANTVDEESMDIRRELVAKCTELFGVDLSRYEHGAQARSEGLDAEKKPTTSKPAGPDFLDGDTITLNVDEIEMVMKNGKLIIKLLKEKADEQEKI
jgi:hypothetical protein